LSLAQFHPSPCRARTGQPLLPDLVGVGGATAVLMIVLGWLYSHFGGRHFGAWLYCVYCFARYLDFAWRAFAAHSLDAQAKLFSLAVVGGLACELLHHSATLEPAARGHLKDVSKRTASPFPRAVRWTRAEDPLTNSISECEPDDQSDCNFQHHRGLGFTRTPPEHLKLKGGVSGTSSFCTCP
jgi:hypothetical protein